MIQDVILLRKGAWEAKICPRLGGNVVSLTYEGQDVYHPLTEESLLDRDPYIYGAPILLPANRTYKGRFVFEGKEYRLPLNEPKNDCHLHGLVLFQVFETVSAAESEVCLRLTDESARIYPFPFSLTVRYALSDEGLLSEYTITNIGEGRMPLTFCLHATFTEPEVFSLPIDLCQEKDDHELPTGRFVPLNPQEALYVTGSPSRDRFVSGYYRSAGHTARIGGVTFTVSKEFNVWTLYNGGGGRGFLSLEPQVGWVNGLNMPDGHRVLAPGETLTLWTKVQRHG